MTSVPSDPHAITRRITAISLVAALIMVLMKSYALGASGSVSVLASLADSGFDMLGSLFTFFAVRMAAAAPDDKHRYGHGKIEGIAALVQSGIVLASAAFIGFQAVGRIINPQPVSQGPQAIAIIAFTMAMTIWLVWMQTRAVKATGSLAVKGDRAHYTADLAANAVVLIGLVSGAILNAPGLDAIAGLIVAVWLTWGAISLMRSSADHLLDASAPEEDHTRIVGLVLSDPNISNVHQLRARLAGQVMMIQMHVDLDPDLSLLAAHDIVAAAEKRIMNSYPMVDVIIHPDPRPRQLARPADNDPQDLQAPNPPVDRTQSGQTGPWG